MLNIYEYLFSQLGVIFFINIQMRARLDPEKKDFLL